MNPLQIYAGNIQIQREQIKFKVKAKWLWDHGYCLTRLPFSSVKKAHETLTQSDDPVKFPLMSFLVDYLDHSSSNEAPPMFHIWCAYSCLAAASGRRVYMLLDDGAIYTNLYILLVGGAGNGKTWSLMKAKRLIADLKLPFSGSVETPQGMWRFMTGDLTKDPNKPIPPYGGAEHKLFIPWADGIRREVHPMNIIASEFIDFINLDDKAWINSLNNIYDEDNYHYRTKGQGEDVVSGPYINLLGGLTTQIAAGMQKDQIINTGLARRTIFQFGERQWNNAHPNPVLTEDQKAARVRALAHLEKVKTVEGRFDWTPETNAWWHSWYVPNLASVPTRSPSVQGWYATKSTQLMKLAMLTSLSERLDRVLTVGHFEVALAYLTEMEKDLYKIFGGAGRNELADVALKIYNHITILTEPVSYVKLKINFWRDLPKRRDADREIQECLDFLVADKKIVKWGLTTATLQDYIYGTPETMERFVKTSGIRVERATPQGQGEPVAESGAAVPPPQPSVRPELPLASPALAGPSSEPEQAPLLPASAEAPTVPQSPAETRIVPPPMVRKD